jgi:hypothetical protein
MQPKTKHKELWQLISEKEMFKKKRFKQKPIEIEELKRKKRKEY